MLLTDLHNFPRSYTNPFHNIDLVYPLNLKWMPSSQWASKALSTVQTVIHVDIATDVRYVREAFCFLPTATGIQVGYCTKSDWCRTTGKCSHSWDNSWKPNGIPEHNSLHKISYARTTESYPCYPKVFI